MRSIAHSQNVDESAVRLALGEGAATGNDQLALARQWQTALPKRPIPDLESTWNELASYGRDQLRSATCEAVFDAVQTGQVPDGQTFVDRYVVKLYSNALPLAELRSITAEFDQLWRDAQAGTVTANDVRFTLMKIKYC